MHTKLSHRPVLPRSFSGRSAGGLRNWAADLKRAILNMIVMDGPEWWDLHPEVLARIGKEESDPSSSRIARKTAA